MPKYEWDRFYLKPVRTEPRQTVEDQRIHSPEVLVWSGAHYRRVETESIDQEQHLLTGGAADER